VRVSDVPPVAEGEEKRSAFLVLPVFWRKNSNERERVG